MTKLTNAMRKKITERVLDRVRRPREVALRALEHSLALRLVKARFGDDVFERCRALPEGWLRPHKRVRLPEKIVVSMPRYRQTDRGRYGTCDRVLPSSTLELAEYAPLPDLMVTDSGDDWLGPLRQDRLRDELHGWFTGWVELLEELDQLGTQVTATLASFTTVEKLADGWPEGYAELPQEMLAVTGGLPAPRIADLNERIAALVQKKAA